MSFANRLTDTLTVTKLIAGTGIKRSYSAVASYPCAIQPLDDQQSAYHGLAYGFSYKCFLQNSADIRASDKVTDQNGLVYSIVGIKKRTYSETPHIEAILVREDG